MPRDRYNLPPANLAEALGLLSVEDLKKLLRLTPEVARPTRKADLIAALERQLDGDRLRHLWHGLDETQRLAVRETLYWLDSKLDVERFRAKHGVAPYPVDHYGHCALTPLRLFVYVETRYGYQPESIPPDLAGRLRDFVPPPEEPTLETLDEPPDEIRRFVGYHTTQDNSEMVPLIRRNMEHAALRDLFTVLRLIDRGGIAVSAKTSQPSAAAVRLIADNLLEGDFFHPVAHKKKAWHQVVGPIRAFVWPLLVQAARLVEPQGRKLALTKAGHAALRASAAGTSKKLWQRWLKSSLLDEFNRVDTIKGQRGRGKRSMTAPPMRRGMIAAALEECPVGRWVRVEEFSRFMQAAEFDFDVIRDPWKLYFFEQRYDSLGYGGSHGWNILQERYILCFLFEIAATLGLIDIAYIEPEGARRDYWDLPGSNELAFLSRYDGLHCFRLNALGAYCLGLTDRYEPSTPTSRGSLTLFPDLRIQVSDAPIPPDERLLLEAFATAESEQVWRLDRDKTLSSVESGQPMEVLREFLQARDDQPLPETVERFLRDTERRAAALCPTGMALIVECVDADLADLLANNKRTANLCQRVGGRSLIVRTHAEPRFRKEIRKLGYGMRNA